MGEMEGMEKRGTLDKGEWLVHVGQLGTRVKKETLVCKEVKENQGFKEYRERGV